MMRLLMEQSSINSLMTELIKIMVHQLTTVYSVSMVPTIWKTSMRDGRLELEVPHKVEMVLSLSRICVMIGVGDQYMKLILPLI